jgi:WD40 repeat protein
VDDRALFGRSDVSLGRSCYSLARTDGEILFEQEFAENEFVKLRDVSAASQRLAVASYKEHGGSWILDIGGRSLVYRIRVYDLPRRQWVYALDGKKQRINSISGLALSPNGSLLALISQDGILEVYRIPQGSGPTQPGQ